METVMSETYEISFNQLTADDCRWDPSKLELRWLVCQGRIYVPRNGEWVDVTDEHEPEWLVKADVKIE